MTVYEKDVDKTTSIVKGEKTVISLYVIKV